MEWCLAQVQRIPIPSRHEIIIFHELPLALRIQSRVRLGSVTDTKLLSSGVNPVPHAVGILIFTLVARRAASCTIGYDTGLPYRIPLGNEAAMGVAPADTVNPLISPRPHCPLHMVQPFRNGEVVGEILMPVEAAVHEAAHEGIAAVILVAHGLSQTVIRFHSSPQVHTKLSHLRPVEGQRGSLEFQHLVPV